MRVPNDAKGHLPLTHTAHDNTTNEASLFVVFVLVTQAKIVDLGRLMCVL